MKEPSYRDALRVSWHLTWQHKGLWVFGLFAAFWGQLGLLELFGKLFQGNWFFVSRNFFQPGLFFDFGRAIFKGEIPLTPEQWAGLIWLSVMILGIMAVLVFVATVTQGALVYIANKFSKDNKFIKHPEKAWHEGVKHFWRLLFINIIKKCAVALVAGVVAVSVWNVVLEPSAWDNLLFVAIFALAVIIGLVVSFLAVYAVGYVVVEEYPLGKALVSAWHLFMGHPLVSIEVGVVVLLLNIVLLFLGAAGLYVFLAPSLLAWFVAVLAGSEAIFTFGLMLSLGLFVLFALLLASFFSVFSISVWTYLFTKMHKHGLVSRILHWAGHHK